MTEFQKPISLDRNIHFVDAVLKVHSGGEYTEDVANLFAEIEQRHKLKITYGDLNVEEETDASDEWCKSTLFPFLTETHFVVARGDLFTSCAIYNASGKWVSFTWREWGAWIAEWANKFWFPRPVGLDKTEWTRKNRNWEYLDFYSRSYLNYQIENYDTWADTIIQIIKKKSEMQKRT